MMKNLYITPLSHRVKTLFLWLLMTAVCLTGCGLLPKEEEYSRAPVVPEQEMKEEVLTKVIRGDILVTDVVRCSFVPSASEKLSFTIGGERVAHVYVSVGDEVKAGDLLAELDLTGIESQIVSQKDQIDQLNLSLSHLYSSLSIDLEQADLMDEQAKENGVSNWTSRRSSVESTYYTQISSVSNQLAVATARLEELELEKEKRQLKASIDGVVSQMYSFTDGERSVKDREIITIVDMEEALFEVFSSNGALLKEGETYTLITSGKKEMTVTCVLGKNLSLQNIKEEGIYLRPEVPDPELKRGDGGSITVVVEEKKDTLIVPSSAVQTVQGQTVVYIPDDNGFRQMVPVEVGLSNGTVTEIISGLSEGENH